MRRGGLSLAGSEQTQVAGCCKHGNEPSSFVNFGSFLE